METGTRVEVREEVRRRRFTAEEYHRMGEIGIFGEDERVELIEGEIVEMNPIGARHAGCVRALTTLLGRRSGEEFQLDVQNPIKINGGLEPQPDLAVIRAKNYGDSLPEPADALLVIEVSDTTLRYDKNVKLPLYARAGIREAWIMDLPGQAIERHNDPSEDSYGRMERVGRGRSLASEVLPDFLVSTEAALG